jgi:hypothetical protein
MRKYILFIALIIMATYGAYQAISGTVTRGLIGKQDLHLWYSDNSGSTFTRTSSGGYSMSLNKLDWVGIDVLQVYGGGVNQNKDTLSSALTDIGTTPTRALWLAPGTWTLDESLNAGSYTNIIWIIPPGAKFSVDATKTFTIGGKIQAGPYQIFSGSGCTLVNATGYTKSHPEWWGLSGIDVSSNCTSGLGEDDLTTTTLTGGLLGSSGVIRVYAAGEKSGGAGDKSIRFYLGNNYITACDSINTEVDWKFEALVINESATLQRISWVYSEGCHDWPNSEDNIWTGYDSMDTATSGDITMKLTGEVGVSTDQIQQRIWMWERL